jgi:hypothetical protein
LLINQNYFWAQRKNRYEYLSILDHLNEEVKAEKRQKCLGSLCENELAEDEGNQLTLNAYLT